MTKTTHLSAIGSRHDIEKIELSDGYECAVRVWRPADRITAQLIVLHGVVSHSEWLAPLANELVDRGVEVICPDRRGAGLNSSKPGDAPHEDVLVEDIRSVATCYAKNSLPTHLCGFCWGASYAILVIDKMPEIFHSLILLAPSIFPAADIGETELIVSDSDVASELPLVPIDRFTSGPYYNEFIIPDPLRTKTRIAKI